MMLPITTPSDASSSLNNGISEKNETENGEELEKSDISTTNIGDLIHTDSSVSSMYQESKSEVKRHFSDELSEVDAKRPRIDKDYDSNMILAALEFEYQKCREMYCDHLVELFFLEQQGNMMDYYNWRKKPSTLGLLQYLKENAVDEQDFEDLKSLKQALDMSAINSKSSVHQGESVQSILCTSVVSNPSVAQHTAVSSTSPLVTSRSLSTISCISGTNSHLLPTHNSSSVQNPVSLKTHSDPQSTLPSISSTNTNINRQHSIAAVYDASIGSQEQIVERAKQEAYVMQRITDLRKEGLWTAKRLPKVQEPPRAKAHWDYLLEEMMWLSTDFSQERKWKKAAAKKCSKMIVKYFQEKDMQAEKAQREEQLRLKKIAANVSKLIREFWSNVEKFVEFRQQTRLEEKRKKALDIHLNYIVDQTEKFSSWLAEGMAKSHEVDVENPSKISVTEVNDIDFDPEKMSETDDEETIAKEEAESEVFDNQQEVELLKQEGEMPLEELVQSYSEQSVHSKRSLIQSSRDVDDEEFTIDEDEEDDEETIREQEDKYEQINDYSAELKALKDEADIPIESLLSSFGKLNDRSFDETESNTVDSIEDNDSDEYNDSPLESESEAEEIGMQFLINPESEEVKFSEVVNERDGKSLGKSGPSRDITDIAAGAERIQPKGNTLLTTNVVTKIPFLLKHQLREYQHIGLDWLAAMYDRKLNGILADEMGLGKTIQTIALLSHLACDKGIWGPHLIVVPTSVMLNWEMEIKKWCPAFKILTYYGSPKERKQKRQGWTKPNQFHICITSYKLVIQDHQSFRRKKWKYLILDEAQHIKNFKSQRWQMLLNFNTSRRLLLTGTPLQNNLMELWSLMHFLMPNVFSSHRDFKDWFVNPVTGMIEGNHEYNEGLIKRLHKVLRPFLLRRLKQEVEKQLPKKYEHIVLCRLSKRQRFLYEEFMNLTKTKETLANGNFLSVINVLMQLRKVCNHPNLFESRPIVSPFAMEGIRYHTASLVTNISDYDPFTHVNLDLLRSKLIEYSYNLSAFAQHRIRKFHATPKLIEEIDSSPDPPPKVPRGKIRLQIKTTSTPSSSVQQLRTFPIKHQSMTTATRQQILTSPTQHLVQLTSFSQPVLQNSRFVLLSNASLNNPVKTVSNASTIVSVNETNSQQNITISSGNIIKKWNISAPITSVAQSTQIGSHKVPFQIGKLVQTPSGQHILLKPVQTTSHMPLSTPIPAAMKPVLITKPMNPPVTAVVETTTVSDDRSLSEFRKQKIKLIQNEERRNKLRFLGTLNASRCSTSALYAPDLIDVSKIDRHIVSKSNSAFNTGIGYFHCRNCHNNLNDNHFEFTETLCHMVNNPETLLGKLREIVNHFMFVVPTVSAPCVQIHVSHPKPSNETAKANFVAELHRHVSEKCQLLHPIVTNLRTQFPELRLIQYDCGKLQTLDRLLWSLKSGGHRVLIFTQMSRMLDIFEQFLNYHGHTYLRLDGSTKIEQRQALMERFNADKRIFCFILSTRSGGIGVNLTGADTVIFYDSDWNPTMDAQAQDRCHRIGQTRDVHIYRLISEKTVEENILKKAQQKRLLGDVAIEGGNFTTAFFKHNAIRELFGIESSLSLESYSNDKDESLAMAEDSHLESELEQALEEAEEAQDIAAAKTARAEAAAEFAEFDETIPIESDTRDSEEKSPEEKEMDKMLYQLSPVERYAMQFLESIQEPIQAEQLKQAEEIEAHKKEWELGHLKSLKEEEERAAVDVESDRDDLLTMSREDAYSQVKNRNSKNYCRKSETLTSSESNGVDVCSKSKLKANHNDNDSTLSYRRLSRQKLKTADSKYNCKSENNTQCKTSVDNRVLRRSLRSPYKLKNSFSSNSGRAKRTSAVIAEQQIKIATYSSEGSDCSNNSTLSNGNGVKAHNSRKTVFISYTGLDQMPIWAPPTPPQDENDLYIDYSIGFLYQKSVMPESQLPSVYIPKDAKRVKLDSNTLGTFLFYSQVLSTYLILFCAVRSKQSKTRKEELISIPRSLFDRPSATLQKLRKEIKALKMRGVISGGPDFQQLQKLIGSSGNLPQPITLSQQAAASKTPHLILQGVQHSEHSPWAIFEDWTILHVIQFLQELPVNLMPLSTGHIPNWDLVSDALNSLSCSFRSAKMCRHHYETIILPREDGKLTNDPSNKKQKKQPKTTQPNVAQSMTASTASKTRLPKTNCLLQQDGNASFSQLCNSRFDAIKLLSHKRTPTLKPLFINPTGKNQKHIALLLENGITYEQPLTPVQVAANRAERIAKEKAKNHQLQQDQVRQQRQPVPQIKPSTQVKTTVANSLPSTQQQLQHAIQAKVAAALSQNSSSTPKTTTSFISGISSANIIQQKSASQQVADLAKALSQAAASYTSSNQAQMSSVSSNLPEGTRITPAAGSGTVTIPSGVQEIQQQTAVNQATGTVISVSALPQQSSQKIVTAIAPSSQITAHISTATKLTQAQLQAYRQQVIIRQQQQQQHHSARQFQSQTQQIQIQPSQQVSPQIHLQPVTSQPQVQRLQFSGTIGQQSSQQTVSQPSQSLIAASSIKPVTATGVMTSGALPVAVPLASSQQQRIFTTTKPQQVNIARTTTVSEAELAHLLTRNQRSQATITQPNQQSKSISLHPGLTHNQILQLQQAVQQQVVSQPLQQSQSNTLLSQSAAQVSQQVLQCPVTLVKTVPAPSTITSASQTVTIPVSAVTMAGVNILTSHQVNKVGVTTTANTASPINAQLKQLQLLNPQRRIHLQTAQQHVHSGQHQITQVSSSQPTIGSQGGQKIAAIVGQGKAITQIPGGLGTFQIVHQPTAAATPGQTKLSTPVTVQQLQQVIKGGLVLPHNLPHTIHVTQSTSAGGTAQLIPQSLLQAMTQSKVQQSSGGGETQHNTSQTSVTSSPITVTQINTNTPSIKHIQVVSTSQSSQSANASKNIVIGSQSAQAILQAATLQQSQPQTTSSTSSSNSDTVVLTENDTKKNDESVVIVSDNIVSD
ncbi:Helicase domino-like protein, partial [Leptotrombidium deliense]